jgi:hypothetical protein
MTDKKCDFEKIIKETLKTANKIVINNIFSEDLESFIANEWLDELTLKKIFNSNCNFLV